MNDWIYRDERNYVFGICGVFMYVVWVFKFLFGFGDVGGFGFYVILLVWYIFSLVGYVGNWS